ncbi:hypothetical protein BVY03_04810 [bacterium K02(2017)]|nr:hypothetical protein BVY03_04810 [bacterium K02(2017)]
MNYIILISLLFSTLFSATTNAQDVIRIGSKKFTESYLLAEIMAQKIENETNLKVERKFGLGGTLICYEALKNGEIDIYPEYSGTALKTLIKTDKDLNFKQMNVSLIKNSNILFLEPFGFNNTYALAMRSEQAKKLNIKTYSDLIKFPKLRFHFSYEFIKRPDGWLALKKRYGFTPDDKAVGMEHSLSYEAIKSGDTDVIDSYSTDAKIAAFNLKVLKDDLAFFPHYFGAPLVYQNTLKSHPQLKSIINALKNKINDATMQKLNSQVEIDKISIPHVAKDFLKTLNPQLTSKTNIQNNLWKNLLIRTIEHLKLTFLSVFLAIIIGIPLGILMHRIVILRKPIMYLTGMAQTIPSIALLALMIPIFGIGFKPALIALLIYALLPIVRNTYLGLAEIPIKTIEAANGIGLRPSKRLRFVELPLAFPAILAGIKTSAVINIGTATLAAFIGAGGLGEPIITGLALNDTNLILQGAIPAALLAILIEFGLSYLETKLSWKNK